MLTTDELRALARSDVIWAAFDAVWYAGQDKAAHRAVADSEDAGLSDYVERGMAAGLSPNSFFDEKFYRLRYPEVEAGIRRGEFGSGFEHYWKFGWRSHQPHWLFDSDYYRQRYADLQGDEGANPRGVYDHFLRFGAKEGREAHPMFQARFYLDQLGSGDKAVDNPFGHFLQAPAKGGEEPCASPYIDPVWYRAAYPEVEDLVRSRQYRGALHHYLANPKPARFDPLCDFLEADYVSRRPDVAGAIADGKYRNGYDHFLRNGVFERHSVLPTFDMEWYLQHASVQRDMRTGKFRDPFAHMLMVGLRTGLSLKPPPPDTYPNEDLTRGAFLTAARQALPALGRDPVDFTVVGAPELSVLMVLHNQFALTMQTLASLRENFQSSLELILVDNASTDDTRTIEDVVRGARILHLQENLGFLLGCNKALELATAPAVLYLNNDVVLHPGAVRNALRRLRAGPHVGAVGGKVVRTNGLLQEAGSLLWRDGAAEGYMRDAVPSAPEANFVRDVDFCSGVFLMLDGALLRRLGGLDEAYAPAYYEEVDLCLRVIKAGYRVVYDPGVALTHLEYGSSRSTRAAVASILRNKANLVARHADLLRTRYANRDMRVHARALGAKGRRVLFIEDTVPLHRLGAGLGRAADTVKVLAENGWHVTVLPVNGCKVPLHQISAGLPETVEVLWDRNVNQLHDLLRSRRGFYDLIWVNRAHNLRRVRKTLDADDVDLNGARMVLDTEAVFSLREQAQAELEGMPFQLEAALSSEYADTWIAHSTVAVNQREAEVLRTLGMPDVRVIGIAQDCKPEQDSFESRSGLLFVGSLYEPGTPNWDGLTWFLQKVVPQLVSLVPGGVMLTVAGYLGEKADPSVFQDNPHVRFLGPTINLAPLYAAARAFVAPARFAAGCPYKIYEAAAKGLPVACTTLLRDQIGWTSGKECVVAPHSNEKAFAKAVASLMGNRTLWNKVRSAALARIAADCSWSKYSADVLALAEGQRTSPAP